MKCSDCRFWQPWHASEGHCKRFPPERLTGGSGAWPLTLADDWCGEFAPKTEHQPATPNESEKL